MEQLTKLINGWSELAGKVRALLVILNGAVVGLLASGPLGNVTWLVKGEAYVLALIAFLTRFTGLGNRPPTLTPPVVVEPPVTEVPGQPPTPQQ